MEGLVRGESVELRRPLLVAAFRGWNDAGDAATHAATWLVEQGDATRIAYVDPEEHIDFQSTRPQVELIDGVTRQIAWPANEFFAVRLANAPRDLVVLLGVEPNYRWRAFCELALGVAVENGCEMAVTFGALLADTPHTRPPRVTGTTTDPDMMDRLDLVRSRYEGPTGIVGVLHDACHRADIQSVSLWVPVPHYIAQPPHPAATLALLERFDRLAELGLDLSELAARAEDWTQQVAGALTDDENAYRYVAQLEERYDTNDEPTLPTGDELAAELERFLRDQD